MTTAAPPQRSIEEELRGILGEPPPPCDGALANVRCDNPAAWLLTKPCGHLPLQLCNECRIVMVDAFRTAPDPRCLTCNQPVTAIWRPL